ncbi:MAG TPA: hypothetical protein VGC97_07040 [Pyrinomonadaceae bacterium]|jgi:hypothetical protein
MPKDPPRNQPNYKIGGYHINEYEYTNNKGEITKEEENQFPRPKQNQEDREDIENNAGEKSNARNNS